MVALESVQPKFFDLFPDVLRIVLWCDKIESPAVRRVRYAVGNPLIRKSHFVALVFRGERDEEGFGLSWTMQVTDQCGVFIATNIRHPGY